MEMLNKCLTAADLGIKQYVSVRRDDQEEIDKRHNERKELSSLRFVG